MTSDLNFERRRCRRLSSCSMQLLLISVVLLYPAILVLGFGPILRMHPSHGVTKVSQFSTGCQETKKCLLSRSDEHDDIPNDHPIPPVVWQYCPKSRVWEQSSTATISSYSKAVQQTWAWCHEFVYKELQLCPWARASMETSQAMQVFVVPSSFGGSDVDCGNLVLDVGKRFESFLKEQTDSTTTSSTSAIEAAAIFFVIIDNNQPRLEKDIAIFEDFGSFYDWFVDLEDEWPMDDVIVAPFHPEWAFAGEPDQLQFEKRSPFPTVSLVSARVVDAAGEVATNQIGIQNEQTLLSKSPEELQALWTKCIQSDMMTPKANEQID